MLSTDLPPDTRHDLVERRGGWILSACLHVMFFSALILARQAPLDFPPVHPPIRVELTSPAEDAAAVSSASPATPRTADLTPAPAPEPTVSTAPAPLAAPPPLAQAPGAAGGDEAAPLALKDWSNGAMTLPPFAGGFGRPSIAAAMKTDDAALGEGVGLAPADRDVGDDLGRFTTEQLAALRRQGDQAARENAAQGRAGSMAVAGRLGLAHAGIKAQGTIFSQKDAFKARGAAEGVIRNIDTLGVSQAEAQKVLARYGIRILIDAGAGGGDAFRAGATTHEERIVKKIGQHGTLVFTFGAAALGRMVQIEEEALHAQGFDPTHSRVVSVTYGIVSTGAGYDLGVERIEAEPLRPGDK